MYKNIVLNRLKILLKTAPVVDKRNDGKHHFLGPLNITRRRETEAVADEDVASPRSLLLPRRGEREAERDRE